MATELLAPAHKLAAGETPEKAEANAAKHGASLSSYELPRRSRRKENSEIRLLSMINGQNKC